jgi:hypothetical protein
MKTFNSRAAFAALLAASLGTGFALLGAGAAHAQVSPADPNYNYETRGHITAWHGGFAPAAQSYAQGALNARASAAAADRGQDPDPNVRLQLRRSEGIFDR